MSVSVLDYGCVIKNIIVPAKNGPVDVVLGHDTMADYENDFTSSGSTCCGAFVGRYANRIENAVFTLGGKTYQLEKNNGENHLHGCFSRKIYEVKYFGDTLLMEAVSPDGEDGFPGTLKIAVRYTLTDDNTFRMDYRVSSDADTLVNLTNHSYFNLDGGGDVLNQKLRIYASRYLEGNNATCPTGNILPVANTPMDFTAGKTIGKEIDTGFSQTTMVGGGYDHCYVIDRARGSSQSICAWATSDKTGISMKLYTTQPGIHKLEGLASQYEGSQLQRQVYVDGRPKSANKDLPYSVDALFTAINTGRMVRFRYKKAGRPAPYTISPWQMAWENGCYYLIAYQDEKEPVGIRHYRVDKMAGVTVLDEPRRGKEQFADLDLPAYLKKHFQMFGGPEYRVTLRCTSDLESAMRERFGASPIFVPEGKEHFHFDVPVCVSDQFYGWVCGFGGKIEVVSPAEVRDGLRALNERLVKMHQ